MNMTDVATWGQPISSAAVLVTLVYLSVQTRQTATLLRSESQQATFDGDLQALITVATNPGIWLDWVSENELPPERKIRLDAYLLVLMRAREFEFFQYQEGVLNEAVWQSYRSSIPIIVGTKRTRAWWTQVGHTAFNSEFRNLVDELIKNQPHTDYFDKVLALE